MRSSRPCKSPGNLTPRGVDLLLACGQLPGRDCSLPPLPLPRKKTNRYSTGHGEGRAKMLVRAATSTVSGPSRGREGMLQQERRAGKNSPTRGPLSRPRPSPPALARPPSFVGFARPSSSSLLGRTGGEVKRIRWRFWSLAIPGSDDVR